MQTSTIPSSDESGQDEIGPVVTKPRRRKLPERERAKQRKIRAIDEVQKDMDRVMSSQDKMSKDYTEALMLMLGWSFLVLLLLQLCGYHVEVIKLLKFLLAAFCLPTGVIVFMYIRESRDMEQKVEGLLARRDAVLKMVKEGVDKTKPIRDSARRRRASPLLVVDKER